MANDQNKNSNSIFNLEDDKSSGSGAASAKKAKETAAETSETVKQTASQTETSTTKAAKTVSAKTDSAESNGDSVKDTAKGFYEQAKDTAGHAFEIANAKATSAIDEKRATLSSGLATVADSIKLIGDNIRETTGDNAISDFTTKYGDNLAKQIEGVSDYFENTDVREMLHDVESFARKNPAYFIGGAFALGFLAARFLKTSPKNLTKGSGQNVKSARASRTEKAAAQTDANPS